MLKIWGRRNSAHTQRVLWLCEEASLPYELILASATMGPDGHISGGGSAFGVVDTPAYRAMNPNGTIPTIDDDGFVLWESNTISRYLAQAYAPQALFGDDIKTLGLASQWMDWTNTQLEPALHILVMELVRLPENERSPANLEATRQGILPALQRLNDHLADRAYVAGNEFTIGDIAPATAVRRWYVFALDAPPMPHLAAWQARMAERTGFRRHIEPLEFHLR
ncbi:MAG: glutathione S-transferase family protein [Rhodospirillaceae bacterium]|nr:glutathione S-transferase family protein [Rhodospirillaceae bacterium]MDD9916916.1 glutathione S-transferase family protein [Rhodospirillaceae bacterium]